MKPNTRNSLGLLLAVGGWALFAAGCASSGKPESASFASVQIFGNTPGQISKVTVAVFRENGYAQAKGTSSKLVFEKEGTKWDNAAYGSFVDDAPVWIRVKAEIVPISDQVFRLECHAYIVKDRGQATFEEETKLSDFKSRPYQKLMDEVARRLSPPQPKPS